MEPRIEKIATLFWELDMLTPASARLLADTIDGEPPAMADLEDISRDISDTPSFFGGPEKNRLRHCLHMQRSRMDAIPN